VRDDIDAALADTRPDVVLMSTASTLAATEADLLSCIRAGAGVISAGEELLAPWASDPGRSDVIDAAAREHGVSVLASGHVDALWVHLPLTLAGIVTHLDRLEGECTRPFAVARSSNAGVSGLLGAPVERYPVERSGDPGAGAAFSSLHAIARGMGLTVLRARSTVTAAIAEQELVVQLPDGERRIAPGTIAGSTRTVELETSAGVALVLHDVARVGAHSTEHWRVSGSPDVELRASAAQGLVSTATQMVARIEDALNVEPGLHTLSDLPPLRYRALG
ncbi:hypothetical protein ACFPZL_10045, partial [Leucobacter soli]